jgi:type I restriction enzyme S subunit
VAAIEEHFSRLDAAEESLRRAQKRLEGMRRAVLSIAVSEGEEKRVGDLLVEIEAGKSFKCHNRPSASDEWGVIKVSAMTWGSFNERENKAVLSEDLVDPRWEIGAGDLLLSRANTTDYVGASVLVGRCRPRLLLSDKSMRLLTKPDVEKAWLQLALSTPSSRSQMSAVATGTSDSMRNISQGKVMNVRVNVPPFPDQRRIVAEVERQLSLVGALAAATTAALKRSAALHRAILERAFTGKLVPQDPTDEPASVLLEWIRAERETQTKPGKRRGRVIKPTSDL